jgi:hypothetical protein
MLQIRHNNLRRLNLDFARFSGVASHVFHREGASEAGVLPRFGGQFCEVTVGKRRVVGPASPPQ